jgi:hypothetical protein
LNLGINQSVALAASTDFNTVTAAGSYYTADNLSTNAPVTGDYWYLTVQEFSPTNYSKQTATRANAPGETYTRIRTAGTWNAWRQMGIPMRGFISGLTLSTAGSSNTFSVAAGDAVDSTNSNLMQLASAYSKTYAPWVVGSGNGALDTGSATAGAWYHVFQIKRPDTGVVDILISLSATAPTLPANYTLFRRIGAMKINTSGFWVKFFQFGDEFLWDVPVADASALAITTSVSAIALTVPPGVIVDAMIQGDYTNSSAAQSLALVYSPNGSAQAAGVPSGNWSLSNSVATVFVTNAFNVMTNTSAQISAVSANASGNSLYIITKGWVDTRGRLS